jgi:hypothetical protein
MNARMTLKIFLVKRNSAVYPITPSCSINVTEDFVVNSGNGSKRNSFIKLFTNQHIFGNVLTQKICKSVIKAIPLQAWTGPEGSRRLRLPDFKTIGT